MRYYIIRTMLYMGGGVYEICYVYEKLYKKLYIIYEKYIIYIMYMRAIYCTWERCDMLYMVI